MKPPKALRSFLGVKKKALEVETRDVPDGYKQKLRKGKESFGKDKIRDPKQLQPRSRKRSTSSPASSRRRQQYGIGPRTQSGPWSYNDPADEGYYGEVGFHQDPQPYGVYQSYDPYNQVYAEYDHQYQQYPVQQYRPPPKVPQRPHQENRGRAMHSQYPYPAVDYDYNASSSKFDPYYDESQFEKPARLQRSTSCPAIDDRRTRGGYSDRASADDRLKSCINDLERLSMKLGDAEETCEKLNEVYQITSGASSSRSYGQTSTARKQVRPNTPYSRPEMTMPVEENPYEIGYGPSKAESLSSGYSSGSGASYYHGYGAGIPEQNVYGEYQGSEDSWNQFWSYMYSDPEGVYGTYGTYGSATGGSVYDEDIYGQNGWYYLPNTHDQYSQQQDPSSYGRPHSYYGWDTATQPQYEAYGPSTGYPSTGHLSEQERMTRDVSSSSSSQQTTSEQIAPSSRSKKSVRFNRTVNQRLSTADKTFVRDTVSKIKEAADECKPSTSSKSSR